MEVWFQERRKEGGGQALGQVCDRGCQEATTSWSLGTRAGEELTPSQRRSGLMAALGTVQVHSAAAWRTQTSLKWCRAQQGDLCDRSHGGMQQSQRKTHGPAHQERRKGRFSGLEQGQRFSRRVTPAQAHRSGQSRSKL